MNELQQKAYNLYLAGHSFFITGSAGTGKSFVLNKIVENLKYKFSNPTQYAITSMTGVSSAYLNGQTLHSWSGIRLALESADELTRLVIKRGYRGTWMDVKVLIIDEISMMDLELFEKLHKIGCTIRKNNTSLFGGIQVIFSGDFLQLPPINSDTYCFESEIWNYYIRNVVYLQKIIRQSDIKFATLLCDLRMGQIKEEYKTILNNRKIKFVDTSGLGILPTVLYPLRKDVDGINDCEFNKLTGVIHTYYPTYGIIGVESVVIKGYSHRDDSLSCIQYNSTKRVWEELGTRPYNKIINLRVGSQVMLTVNLDVSGGLVNGSRGIIIDFDFSTQLPVILFDNGVQLILSPFKYEVSRGTYAIKVEQIPLILAWATTIHKSQSATLSLVQTNLKSAFATGQIYVCLSRVKSLEGLYLDGINFDKITTNSKALKYYQGLSDKCQLQIAYSCLRYPYLTIATDNKCCAPCITIYKIFEKTKLPFTIIEKIIEYI